MYKHVFNIFIESFQDKEKRAQAVKRFGEYTWKFFFRSAVYLFFSVLTIWIILWSLDYSEEHRIIFFPPNNVIDYLTAEHSNLASIANDVTSLPGKSNNVSFDLFDSACIKTVKPIKIYCDEYGVYLVTSKSWYHGEHGIFIAKDENRMPPELNWGLIEGRIFTYAIFD